MKPIKITIDNADKIDAAIEQAEGRATQRTALYLDCERAIQDAATHPVLSLLTQREQIGVTLCHTVDHQVARCYGYSMQATALWLKRKASGWFLVKVARVTVYSPGKPASTAVTVKRDHLDAARDRLARTVSIDYLNAAA